MMSSLNTIALQTVTLLVPPLISAWVAVKLSQRQYRAERLWDRKVVAYERVVEALYKSKRFSSEHINAEYSDSNISEERDKELRHLAQEAQNEIRKTAEIGSFTLAKTALKIISDYESEVETPESLTAWHEYLEHDFKVTDKYLKLFIDEAKRDLER